jgi:hypothetical protein
MLALSACSVGGGDDDGDEAAPSGDAAFANYKIGTFEDTTTNNFWAYMDPESSVWNAYVLAPTKPAFFGPGSAVSAFMAQGSS